MTRHLALEGRHHGIRVNSLSPGLIETGATRGLLQMPEFAEAMIDKIMLGRPGRPEEVAAAALFLRLGREQRHDRGRRPDRWWDDRVVRGREKGDVAVLGVSGFTLGKYLELEAGISFYTAAGLVAEVDDARSVLTCPGGIAPSVAPLLQGGARMRLHHVALPRADCAGRYRAARSGAGWCTVIEPPPGCAQDGLWVSDFTASGTVFHLAERGPGPEVGGRAAVRRWMRQGDVVRGAALRRYPAPVSSYGPARPRPPRACRAVHARCFG
jgi:hypothetical protein